MQIEQLWRRGVENDVEARAFADQCCCKGQASSWSLNENE